jgi:chromate reductase, NAD(P)H dehydrogenase (quinone)
MSLPKLVGISGSLRLGSYNTIILETLAERLAGTATLSIYPLADVPNYNEDLDTDTPLKAVADLRDAIAQADGVIIATPEFNHGIPGVLKNALDWASRPYGRAPLKGKDVLTITSSPGGVGGARAHAQLNETLASMAARVVLRPQAVVAGVHTKIVEGRLVDEATLAFLLAGAGDLLRNIAFAEMADRKAA